ncbi:DUF4365 domain-containing protein [Marinifilum caeruleilacunae]|nr:DUF4365 domain-containing protein [Marinifilum caeruleilacunae]
MTLPIRPRAHVLERESINNLHENIPNEWVIQQIPNDYGVDNFVEIVQNQEVNGNVFSIQLKATDNVFENQDYVSVRMRTPTIRYLMNRVELVMIILFVSNENQSYWIWLRDIAEHVNYDNATLTVRIPKQNRLNTINWNRIMEFTELIRNAKVEAARDMNFNY